MFCSWTSISWTSICTQSYRSSSSDQFYSDILQSDQHFIWNRFLILFHFSCNVNRICKKKEKIINRTAGNLRYILVTLHGQMVLLLLWVADWQYTYGGIGEYEHRIVTSERHSIELWQQSCSYSSSMDYLINLIKALKYVIV